MVDATLPQERSDFYVYVIFRLDGAPCYIGKGRGGRWKHHVKNSHNAHLTRIYAKSGGDLPIIKVREHLTDKQAIETEIALIAAVGRITCGACLVNLTDGGDGASGAIRSVEYRKKQSVAQKTRLQDPALRRLRAEQTTRLWSNPGYKDKVTTKGRATRRTTESRNKSAVAITAAWGTSEYREKQKIAQLIVWSDDILRQKHSEITIAVCAKPEVKANRGAGQTKRYADPKSREIASSMAIATWTKPGRRERGSAGIKAAWKDPDRHERGCAAQKLSWADPEVAANRIAGMRAYYARRRAAKAEVELIGCVITNSS
jgi:hypothetical protein